MNMDEDVADGLSLMASLKISATEAARVVVDVYGGRGEDDPATPAIEAAYAELEARLTAAAETH